MKKIICLLMAAALLLSAAACAKQPVSEASTSPEPAAEQSTGENAAAEETEPAEEVEPAEEAGPEETEPAEEESTVEAEPEDEDGQNPVMNFIGRYVADRAEVLVEALGARDGKITVTWPNSASELVQWEMSGPFDENSPGISYSDCVKKVLTFNEEGEIVSEVVEYEQGSGRVDFLEFSALSWTDDQEQIADGTVFTADWALYEPAEENEQEASAFLGTWVCGRAALDIAEYLDGYKCVISWADSAAEMGIWDYDCYFDGTNLVSNETGVHKVLTYGEDGLLANTEIVFDDGAVSFGIEEDGALTWNEFKEGAGDDMAFEHVDRMTFVPTADEVTELYFNKVAGYEPATAGSSLSRALSAYAALSFCAERQFWAMDEGELKAALEAAWDNLDEAGQEHFRICFTEVSELFSGCQQDWESVRGPFEDGGVAGEMESLMAFPMNQVSWAKLRALTEEIVNG